MSDMPDFTTKSDVRIYGQTIDLTVLAPSAEAVSVGEPAYKRTRYYGDIPAGSNMSLFQARFRGRFIEIIGTIETTSSTSEINLEDLHLVVGTVYGPLATGSFPNLVKEFGMDLSAWYMAGRAAGTHFPPTSDRAPFQLHVVKTISDTPSYAPTTWAHTLNYPIRCLSWSFRLPFEVYVPSDPDVYSVDIKLYNNSSTVDISVRGVVIWGGYI